MLQFDFVRSPYIYKAHSQNLLRLASEVILVIINIDIFTQYVTVFDGGNIVSIHCLMNSSVVMTDKTRSLLFDIACGMLREGEQRKTFREDDIEGVVTTRMREQSIGAIVGTEFRAEVETEKGKGEVTFLVRDADAKTRNGLSWQSVVPVFVVDLSQESSGTVH